MEHNLTTRFLKKPNTALFNRAMTMDCRDWRMYVLRFVLLVVIMLTLPSGFQGASPGLTFFQVLTGINLVVITLLGITSFSNVVSEEKEAQMLGLLLMAGMTPLSLLISKGVSRLSTAGILIVMQLPLTLLAVALGGISLRQIVAAYVCVLAYMVLVASMAMAASTVSCTNQHASGVTVVALLIFYFGFMLKHLIVFVIDVATAGRVSLKSDWLEPWASMPWQLMSPGHRLWGWHGGAEHVFASKFSGSMIGLQAMGSMIVAAGLIWLSAAVFNRYTREGGGGAKAKEAAPRRRKGTSRAGRAWESRPLAWHTWHFFFRGHWSTIGRVVVFAFAIGGWCMYTLMFDSNPTFEDLSNWLLLVGGGGVFLEVMGIPGHLLKREVTGKTLPALMLMPMRPSELVREKLRGSLLSCRPALAVLAVALILPPIGMRTLWIVAGVLVAIPVMALLTYIGLFMSLIEQKTLAEQIAGVLHGIGVLLALGAITICTGIGWMAHPIVGIAVLWGLCAFGVKVSDEMLADKLKLLAGA
jgi:hypothetical protein